jgi:hypothetical protein
MFTAFMVTLTVLTILCFIGSSIIAPAPSAAMLFVGAILLGAIDCLALFFWVLGVVTGHVHFHVTYS